MSSILKVAAALLCGGSLFCSAGLWVNEQTNLLAMVLAGVFAGALELCKFAFFPAAANLWNNSKIKSIGMFFLSLVLLIVSIVATVAFLETGAAATINKSVSTSATYRILNQEVESLNRQIATVNGLLEADLQNNYRKRAYDNSEKLALLRATKNETIEKLIHLRVRPENGIHSLFATAAKNAGVSETSVRQTTFVIAAIMVDVCGIVCLLLLSVQSTRTAKETQNTPSTKITAKEEATPKLETETISSIKQKVLSGEYGHRPVMRKIIEQEKIRHPELKKLFLLMIKDGQLKKVGKGVELVNRPGKRNDS